MGWINGLIGFFLVPSGSRGVFRASTPEYSCIWWQTGLSGVLAVGEIGHILMWCHRKMVYIRAIASCDAIFAVVEPTLRLLSKSLVLSYICMNRGRHGFLIV